jgi:hypothetical protein
MGLRSKFCNSWQGMLTREDLVEYKNRITLQKEEIGNNKH